VRRGPLGEREKKLKRGGWMKQTENGKISRVGPIFLKEQEVKWEKNRGNMENLIQVKLKNCGSLRCNCFLLERQQIRGSLRSSGIERNNKYRVI